MYHSNQERPLKICHQEADSTCVCSNSIQTQDGHALLVPNAFFRLKYKGSILNGASHVFYWSFEEIQYKHAKSIRSTMQQYYHSDLTLLLIIHCNAQEGLTVYDFIVCYSKHHKIFSLVQYVYIIRQNNKK